MKRSPKKKQPPMKVIRLWRHPDALAALPYIRLVVESLREHWLEVCKHKRTAQLLAKKPGRPDRATLIAQEEAGKEREQAEQRFQEALDELMALDVYCLDPVSGLALIPFRQGDELAWYVFDVFEPEGLRNWRLHTDALEIRRPIEETPPGEAPPSGPPPPQAIVP